MTRLTWRNQPVFISSTFRDMHLERDYLWRFVFPWLGEYLAQRCVHLEPIDLRWGIDSASLDHAELKERHILRVCLSEINRSKPFIIVLLGRRYGWVPPKPLAQSVFGEMGVPGHDVEGKSVTHLEIDHGVFNTGQVTPYFYLEDAQAQDDEGLDADATNAQVAKMQQLRDLITQRFPDRVRRYARSNLAGLGELVKDDLRREFSVVFPEQASGDLEQLERDEIERFVEKRVRRAVMGHALAESLATTAQWCTVVQGPAGGGRSTVFALTYRKASQDADKQLLAHAFGVTTSGTSIEAMLARWMSQLAQSKLGVAQELDGTGALPLVERFWQALRLAAARQPVMLLIDGVEHSGKSALGEHLGWIPPAPIPGVRIVLFDDLEVLRLQRLQRRFKVECIGLEPLNADQASDLIDKVCQTYHRTLSPDIIDLLLSRIGEDGVHCAVNPLWLALATEELNLIDASEYLLMDQRYPDISPEARVVAMLRDAVLALPGSIPTLYASKFRKLQDIFGDRLVRFAIGGMALSDVGVAQSDILEVVRQCVDPHIADLDIVDLRMLLRADLTEGRAGNWRFEHALARAGFLALLPVETKAAEAVTKAGGLSTPSTRSGIARAYWEHFKRTGDRLSQARFACVEEPDALMLYDTFGELDDLEAMYETVVDAYGFAPAWLRNALGECFADLWDDCWRLDLEIRVEDWRVIDDVAVLLWNLSLHARGELKSFREEFLESITAYEKTTRVMMHDFDGKGLWKTVFANRLRVCVLVEKGQWDDAFNLTMDFLGQVNRHEQLDDEELFLFCLLAAAASSGAANDRGHAPRITGQVESRNRVFACALLLVIRELQGQDRHDELLDLAQKYPASMAPHLYDVLYLNRYTPETDRAGLGFLCWQARSQQVRLQDCQPLDWLATEVRAGA
jgi:hypothetical protein